MPLCRPDDPSVTCPGRYDAVLAGTMRRSTATWRWIHQDSAGRWQPVIRCPYCGNRLPDPIDSMWRGIWTREPDVDRYREAQGDGDAEDAD